MNQYIISYFGGHEPSSLEEGPIQKATYMKWFSSLGNAAISPTQPFKITKSCPFLEVEEKHDVSELLVMGVQTSSSSRT